MAFYRFWCCLLIVLLCFGCAEIAEHNTPKLEVPVAASLVKAAQPSDRLVKQRKVMLMLGQDLTSVQDYVDSGRYPIPAGVTTYLSFYSLLSPAFPAFGALGQDTRGKATGETVDWGAGPLNALMAARRFPHAVLNIGLNIAEGNQSELWAEGGLAAIARGEHDRSIRRLAAFVKSLSNPVYLRIGYEFDGVWNKGYESTQDYIEAYRRIVDVMRVEQVSNIDFVWQASASPIDDIIEKKHENITDWYPGDAYVDWVGMSWFLRADESNNGSITQRTLADEVIDFARSKQKPVIIAEASPQGYDLHRLTVANISPLWDGEAGAQKVKQTPTQIWQAWYAPFFAYVRKNVDIIRAVAYINADWNTQRLWSVPYPNGYWGNSQVQANDAISQRWLKEVGDTSFWQHGVKSDLTPPLTK